MLSGLPGIDPVRRAKLIEVLDINPNWRMHTVSDGQRRRVQICLGLLKPFDVLLLDEITVDLDVLGRADLMQFLKEECQQRGATIVYVSCFQLPSPFFSFAWQHAHCTALASMLHMRGLTIECMCNFLLSVTNICVIDEAYLSEVSHLPSRHM